MIRASLKVFVYAAVIAAALFTLPGTSEAGWWHAWSACCDPCGGGGWGGWGGYASPYWGGYAGGWGYGRARHCGWGGCGLNACSWGLGCTWGCAYPAVSCCWTDPCCGYSTIGAVATPGCCGGGDMIMEAPAAAPAGAPAPTPAPAPAPGKVPPPEVPALPRTSLDRSDAGTLTIWVPEDAKVYVNGYLTKSTGNRRQYVSYGLKQGFSYKYEVRAVVVRDGKEIEETNSVTLNAGARNSVAFKFNSKAENLALVW